MFANIRAVLVYPEPSFFLYRIVLVREQFVILSRTGGLQRQSNLFPFFLSLSLDIKHELKIHILDILNAVYLLLVQIGCFYIFKKFCNSATNHIRKNFYFLNIIQRLNKFIQFDQIFIIITSFRYKDMTNPNRFLDV